MDIETIQWEEKRFKRQIRRFHDDGWTYQKIADRYGVSRATIYQCEMGNFPKRSDLREKLGLPPESIALVRHCSCGEIHIRKTCPHKKGENGQIEKKWEEKPVEFKNMDEANLWNYFPADFSYKEFKTKIKVVKA